MTPGKVLVIGQVAFDPAVQPGNLPRGIATPAREASRVKTPIRTISKNIIMVNGPDPDEVRFLMSRGETRTSRTFISNIAALASWGIALFKYMQHALCLLGAVFFIFRG